MNYKNNWSVLLLLLGFFVILTGCSMSENNTIQNSVQVEQKTVSVNADENLFDTSLVENKNVYSDDREDSITDIYVTVLKTKKNSDEPSYTLQDLNNWKFDRTKLNEEPPNVEAIVQEGSSKGPEKGLLGYGSSNANAIMQTRGHGSAMMPQKSFKLTLFEEAGLWKGQKILNLNKHPLDLTRVRNKLSFDFFKLLPDITSFRTQFVHLHVKDLTSKEPDKAFKDYGLFTHVEQPNKQYIKSRGLNPSYNMYKAEFFEFFRYSDILKNTDDPAYNRKAFEEVLSIKGEEDHKKLLKMLDDVNNYSLDINQVVSKHFNRDNYLTWMAANILFGNVDTNSQNFFLYSPASMDTWYFLPWDYDLAWGIKHQKNFTKAFANWESGLSNYWGCVLHSRFFKDPKNIEDLNKKIEEISKIVNKSNTQAFLKKYHDIVAPFIKRNPDIKFLPASAEDFEADFKNLEDVAETNKKKYYEDLEKPMPIFLGDTVQKDNKIYFTWDKSFDIQGDHLLYDLYVSTKPDFSKIIYQKKGIEYTEHSMPKIAAGTYYFKVVIRDAKGNRQEAFDYYVDKVEGDKFYGMKEFIVN